LDQTPFCNQVSNRANSRLANQPGITPFVDTSAFLGTNISGEEFEDVHEQREPAGKLLTSMIKTLLQTDSGYVYAFLRIIAGIIVFPYGMQKLFGWSGADDLAPQESRPLSHRSQRTFLNLSPGSLSSGSRSEVLLLCPELLGRIAAGGLFVRIKTVIGRLRVG
jgi:hypothetical protein